MNKVNYTNDSYNNNHLLNRAFIEKSNSLGGRASDLKAVLYSISRFELNKNNDNYINSLLLRHGKLSTEEVVLFNRVYRETMDELLRMFINEDRSNASGLLEYMGIDLEEKNNV